MRFVVRVSFVCVKATTNNPFVVHHYYPDTRPNEHKPSNMNKNTQEERRQRKRNLIYLINQYLGDYLPRTQKTLREEYKLSDEFQVCDNIDLDAMYLEYCSLFQIKFGKKPKILKKRLIDSNRTNKGVNSIARQCSKREGEEMTSCPPSGQEDMEGVLKITSTTISAENSKRPSLNDISMTENRRVDFDRFPEDWKEIVENICRTLIGADKVGEVNWNAVQGANSAKNVLRESVILPLERPDLFETIRPWRSALLHGPPGTGKTLLAKALAAECSGRVSFFNVHSSAITSKWRGESEKYIRVGLEEDEDQRIK